MKVLVAYVSRTGNTKKVAEAIFEEIREEKEIKQLSEVDGLRDYDLTFVGFPIMKLGGPHEEAKQFLEKHSRGRKMALFITHASHEEKGGKLLQSWLAKCKEPASKADLIGMFNCQGALAQDKKKSMLNHPNPNMRLWAQVDDSQGQPDATRLKRARVFARETIKKLKNLKSNPRNPR